MKNLKRTIVIILSPVIVFVSSMGSLSLEVFFYYGYSLFFSDSDGLAFITAISVPLTFFVAFITAEDF